jgi:hypothetical protein
MATRRLRSFVSRSVLVAGMAAILVGGTAAVGSPSEAAALPYSCTQAQNIALMYLQTAYNLDALGYSALAQKYYGKWEAISDIYYPCGNWGGNGD